MVFSSLSYVFFLPLVFGITYSLAPRFRPHFLLLASYAFYMAWKPQYVLVIIALTLFDFFAGHRAGVTQVKELPPTIHHNDVDLVTHSNSPSSEVIIVLNRGK